LLGSGGQQLADWGPLQALSQGLGLEWQSVQRVGPDLRLLTRAKGRADFSDLE